MEWWEHAIEAFGAARKAGVRRAAEAQAVREAKNAAKIVRPSASQANAFGEKKAKPVEPCCFASRKLKGDGEP